MTEETDPIAAPPARREGAPRSLTEWLAGAAVDVTDALPANRDELRSRGTIMAVSLGLSPMVWGAAAIAKFGTSPAVLVLTAIISCVLVVTLGAIDRDNSIHALRASGRDLLEGPPGVFVRARRLSVGLVRLGFPFLDCLLLSMVILPMIFRPEIAQFRARSHMEANQQVWLEATKRVDQEHGRLRNQVHRQDATLAELAEEGRSIRGLELPETRIVDRELRRRIDDLAADRAAAVRRQAQFESDRDAEIQGIQLSPHHSGRPGRRDRAIAAELQAAAQQREAERLGREIERLSIEANAMREAESRRVIEAMRNRRERIARHEEELKAASTHQAEAMASLRQAMDRREQAIRDLAISDHRFTPAAQESAAADFAALIGLASQDAAKALFCSVCSLMLLAIYGLGPITAMRPIRNGYAAYLAGADAAETEAAIMAATLRRTGFHRRMAFIHVADVNP